MSIDDIATVFNRGRNAMNGTTWNAQAVLSVIRRDELIRRQDLAIRKERLLRA
jgi:hypothetical protein